MHKRSSSASRVSEKRLGFLRRVRNFSSSSSKSSDFDSLEDENSSCDSDVFVEINTTWRILFLGASSVGKTSIIKQFLRRQFSTKHKETLQEMYNGELDLGGSQLSLIIEDTGSSFIQDFPAMAEVSLCNSDGVILC